MDDEEMGSGDSVFDALEMLKGKMMVYMLSKGEKPPEVPGEEPPQESEPDADDMGGDNDADLAIEIDAEPVKPSVMSRFEGGGPPRKPAPPDPMKRGRGRPRKNPF